MDKILDDMEDTIFNKDADYDVSSIVPPAMNLDMSLKPLDDLANDIIEKVTDTGVKMVFSDEGYVINSENKWGWITLYVVTIVVAVLGNLLFIVSSLCTRRSRNTGHYLLLNLSVRDILLAGICIPFTLDSEIIHLTWNLGEEFCIAYRYFYYCFLFFLPLTILFLAYHLFAENCKWNFSDDVVRPWSHTLYIPMIWLLSAAFAVPTVFYSELRPWEDDPYKNVIAWRPDDAEVCMHRGGDYENVSNFFYFTSFVLTFVVPVVLLFIPWWALLVQSAACCTRKLRSSDLWLSVITLFLILIFEASRAPFELFNVHYVLSNWSYGEWLPIPEFLNLAESYVAVMKWAVYAPTMVHPFLYFAFCSDARHGLRILFCRLCPCCLTKSSRDIEANSDDEKNKMLPESSLEADGSQEPLQPQNIPLQSKEEDQM